MGIMACQKNNCRNILCDTYIDDIGHICNDCKEDFKKWLLSTIMVPMNSGTSGEKKLKLNLLIIKSKQYDI